MNTSHQTPIRTRDSGSIAFAWKLFGALLLTLNCNAQGFVDQSFVPPDSVVRLDTQVGVAPFFAGSQTFTPHASGQLVGLDFWIIAIGGDPLTAHLQVQIQTTTGQGKPSGSSLGSVILPASFLGQQPATYKHVAMDGLNIDLQAGQLYAAVFQAVPFVSAGNAAYDFRGYSISQLGGNYSYDRGQGMFTEDGRIWRDYAGADFDYVFRTYMMVPEPGVVLLSLTAGLLLLVRGRTLSGWLRCTSKPSHPDT